VEDGALDHEEGVRLGEVAQTLGGLDRVTIDEGDGARADELTVEGGDSRLLGCQLGERVLDHGEGGVATEGAAQLGELLDGEPAVLRENGRVRAGELLLQLGNGSSLISFTCHVASLLLMHRPPGCPADTGNQSEKPRRRARGSEGRDHVASFRTRGLRWSSPDGKPYDSRESTGGLRSSFRIRGAIGADQIVPVRPAATAPDYLRDQANSRRELRQPLACIATATGESRGTLPRA